MATPLQRFIDAYINWRYNPFTSGDMAVDKTEDNLSIPSGSPFFIQLLEVPRKNTPTSITVYNYNDGGYMTEAAHPPAQGQFSVDYPAPDGKGTGLVEFNSADANKQVRVAYKATGSPIVSEFLDSKVSWPSPSPGENQGVIFKSSVPTWAYFPKRYFHEDNALYHSGGESESCIYFRFKKGANDSKVFLELKGAKIHRGYYTELAEHDHEAGTLKATHKHGAGTLTGSQPTHRHGYQEGTPFNYTQYAGDDAVTISGETAEVEADVSGNVANASSGEKSYPNQLKIYVDGVDKTASFLSLSGLPALGDGSGSHVFVTTGSGEVDVSSWFASAKIYEIKITEPITYCGGRALLHVEVY
jgi:hypothetical protein